MTEKKMEEKAAEEEKSDCQISFRMPERIYKALEEAQRYSGSNRSTLLVKLVEKHLDEIVSEVAEERLIEAKRVADDLKKRKAAK